MFEKTRLKLTAWYLLIIMAVSFLFSLVIYRVADLELKRIGRRQHLFSERLRTEIFKFPYPRSMMMEEFNLPVDVNDVRKRIILTLIIVNSGILLVAGLSGYFLAGRTLAPIKDMVDEQNRFISDASHEFRTPLTSLKSAMEVHLRDKKLTLAQAKSLIAENIEDVNKLQSLSDALLQLAQYQKPNHQLIGEKLSVREIVLKAIKKIAYLAKKKNIMVKYRIEDAVIVGDKEGLTDLLVILLDNALKYSPPMKKVIVESKKTDGSVLLTVKDQGIGIDKKDFPYIFDRFYRSEASRSKTTADGYGLGLSIAKKIVQLHHGSISVDSKTGVGTTFIVHLPVKQSKS